MSAAAATDAVRVTAEASGASAAAATDAMHGSLVPTAPATRGASAAAATSDEDEILKRVVPCVCLG